MNAKTRALQFVKAIDRLIDKRVVAERETYDSNGQVIRSLHLIS